MIRANLKEDERMTTIFDGIALYTSQPEILEIFDLIMGGSVFKSGSVPWLGNWYNLPVLESVNASSEQGFGYGGFVCGRKLGLKD